MCCVLCGWVRGLLVSMREAEGRATMSVGRMRGGFWLSSAGVQMHQPSDQKRTARTDFIQHVVCFVFVGLCGCWDMWNLL